jgi:apolipoprotein N-acyltransferase
VVASVPARGQEVLVESVGLSSTQTLAVRLGVWPGRLALVFLVVHTAVVLITYRRRRQRDRDGQHDDPGTHRSLQPTRTLERGTPA